MLFIKCSPKNYHELLVPQSDKNYIGMWLYWTFSSISTLRKHVGVWFVLFLAHLPIFKLPCHLKLMWLFWWLLWCNRIIGNMCSKCRSIQSGIQAAWARSWVGPDIHTHIIFLEKIVKKKRNTEKYEKIVKI